MTTPTQPAADAQPPPGPETIEDLWRREYPIMVRLARALVDSPERAEEIVQDAFAHTLRRWSSLDRPANYALKLSMGFVLHPAIHDAAAGYPVSGVYFVKRVDGDTPLTQPRC